MIPFPSPIVELFPTNSIQSAIASFTPCASHNVARIDVDDDPDDPDEIDGGGDDGSDFGVGTAVAVVAARVLRGAVGGGLFLSTFGGFNFSFRTQIAFQKRTQHQYQKMMTLVFEIVVVDVVVVDTVVEVRRQTLRRGKEENPKNE